MKVLVLGGSGMLGHQLVRTLSRDLETHCTFRRFDKSLRDLAWFDESRIHVGIDALDGEAVAKVLSAIKPAWVINCVGTIKQLAAAKDPETTLTVNALLPHRLARQCQQHGARLIHISTDCVFSGTRGDYTETDNSDATDLYGRTKFLGEVTSHDAITIRTSIVGTALHDNLSLFDWFVSRGDVTVKGFTQAIYTGLTTERLADEIKLVIERSLRGGLWQIAGQKINKHELLLRLGAALDLKTRVVADYDFKCDRSLSPAAYQTATGFVPPSWDTMIELYARNRRTNYGWKQS